MIEFVKSIPKNRFEKFSIIAMPLTMVMNTPYEVKVSTIKKAKEELLVIKNDLINGNKDIKTITLKSKIISKLGKFEKHAAKLFGLELHANKNCTSCGKCWRECPSKNIYPDENNNPKFKLNCSMCMKCIYDCPVNSIHPRISKFLPLKEGYSVKDYIK